MQKIIDLFKSKEFKRIKKIIENYKLNCKAIFDRSSSTQATLVLNRKLDKVIYYDEMIKQIAEYLSSQKIYIINFSNTSMFLGLKVKIPAPPMIDFSKLNLTDNLDLSMYLAGAISQNTIGVSIVIDHFPKSTVGKPDIVEIDREIENIPQVTVYVQLQNGTNNNAENIKLMNIIIQGIRNYIQG